MLAVCVSNWKRLDAGYKQDSRSLIVIIPAEVCCTTHTLCIKLEGKFVRVLVYLVEER